MPGILDLLQGQGGGSLLDFLRQNAMNQNAPGLQQSDTANYGAPGPMSFAPPPQAQVMPANQPNSIDSAAWPQGPVGAPMNANASMPRAAAAPMSMAGPQPAAAPAPAPQAAPEGDGRFMLGLKGFLGNLSGGPIGALAGGLGAAVTGQPTDAGTIQAQQSNLTARALIAKGADPVSVAAASKNPLLMAELIKQHYGPQTVTSLGNGYVWDQKAGKAVKAYEPDAKPPTSLGNGYIWNPETSKVERAFTPEAKPPTSLGEGYIYNPTTGAVERAYTPEGKKDTPQAQMAQREQALVARGLDPKDARNQQFVLTGKFPREDAQPLTATDKKAILEADDAVMAATNVIGNLQKIKELSKKAFEGPLAGTRGYIGSLVGNESATATSEMDNLITSNALQQLKSIFGGNPTEGERAILLKIQGASSQPDSVRQKIFDQATTLAQRRLDFEKQRADALRGGSFYKPGQGASPQLQPGQSTGMGDVVIKRID